jgi:uncharacterized BrkB/YihY/UPF0761 family membrane protein
MGDISRAEFEEIQRTVRDHARRIEQQETQYAVINTKLTAILWVLGTVGAAVVAVVVKVTFGVSV